MKIFNKVIAIIIFFTMIMSIGLAVFAADSSGWGDGLISEMEENSNGDDESEVSEDVGNLLGNVAVITKIVAVATAVVIIIVLAMKYMIAAPGEKADVKRSMIPFVIGAFVVFGAAGIISMIISFSSQIKGE